jgi:hypothetical protein
VGVLGNEAPDRAAKEAAGYNSNARTNPEPQPEPESLQTMIATTKSIIRQTVRDKWELSWETAKHGTKLFRLGVRPGKGVLTTHIGTHKSDLLDHYTDAHRQDQFRAVLSTVLKYT